MLRVKPEAQALLPRVDTILFDIDGVLLDVSHSIRMVNRLSIPAYLRTLPGWTAPDDLITSEEIECFKTAGGFNDDWDLTCAAVLLYLHKSARADTRDAAALHYLSPTVPEFTSNVAGRGGWLRNAVAVLEEGSTPEQRAAVAAAYDPARIRRLFQELWAGDHCRRLYGFDPSYYPGPGWTQYDRPLLETALLSNETRTLGVLTGRTRAEAAFALERVGLQGRIRLPEQGRTKDENCAKPDPFALSDMMQALDCRIALYIGDAVDDLRTVLRYRQLPGAEGRTVLSAQVLTGTVGPTAPDLFAAADIIAPDVNAVLRLLMP